LCQTITVFQNYFRDNLNLNQFSVDDVSYKIFQLKKEIYFSQETHSSHLTLWLTKSAGQRQDSSSRKFYSNNLTTWSRRSHKKCNSHQITKYPTRHQKSSRSQHGKNASETQEGYAD
jgi:hypothetical protein